MGERLLLIFKLEPARSRRNGQKPGPTSAAPLVGVVGTTLGKVDARPIGAQGPAGSTNHGQALLQ